ncbi:MAG: M1 family metallopeptidase [Acidobacteria bacterium]|nr:M1 family metallopeptidase [Acidobacteriota bacterium]
MLPAGVAAPPTPRPAQTVPSATAPGAPLSERVVAYQMDARLDAQKKIITATEILTYRNLTGQSLQEFPFHLYLNGFQPESSFFREIRRRGSSGPWEEKHRGSIDIKSFEVVGQGDLMAAIKFMQPDDGNPNDKTVFQVRLPKPIPPGASVEFRIAFQSKLPETVARTGYMREFIFAAQWFPKVGVWWRGAWNCHQFHSTTEFFADFGTYDVKLTVPQNYIVGSSGEELSSMTNPDGTKTLTLRGEDIHDFAWTADPNFRVFEDSWTGSAGAVKIRVLMQPDHESQAARYVQAQKGTLDRFERWYGPYPYNRITVVDPARGSAAGGMEYPTLFTGDTYWLMPAGLLIPEVVVEHEFGHQYWYGMVASNEFEDAWLDEGINSYTEVKIMDSLYGAGRSFFNQWGLALGDADFQRLMYQGVADTDPMVRSGWQFMSGGAYGGITYGKTATVLLTLEGLIGEETLRRALNTYFQRYRFKHPTEEDFLKTVEEVSSQNLRWYFDQAVYSTQVLDYSVDRILSDPVEWFAEKREEKKGVTLYRSHVVVRRLGDFIFPVEVEIKFDNGETLREKWDGKDRWTRFSYEKKARVISATVDPGRKVPLDHNLFNNSRTLEPNPQATRKIANVWRVVVQMLAQVFAWLA